MCDIQRTSMAIDLKQYEILCQDENTTYFSYTNYNIFMLNHKCPPPSNQMKHTLVLTSNRFFFFKCKHVCLLGQGVCIDLDHPSVKVRLNKDDSFCR